MSVPGVVIQARVGSTRLPGKVLERVQGDTLLGHLLVRLGRCARVGALVVAAPIGARDDAVAHEAERHGAQVFRGSEGDVLSRYLGAARRFELDPVVRITSDCPLIEPAFVDEAIDRYRARAEQGRPVALVTNGGPEGRTYPRGLDVEVVARAALAAADAALAADAPEREHVTQYLYGRAERFAIERLALPLDLSFLRWTVDTPEDLALVRAIYDELYPANPAFGFRDVLALLGRRPELLAINAHVRQKTA